MKACQKEERTPILWKHLIWECTNQRELASLSTCYTVSMASSGSSLASRAKINETFDHIFAPNLRSRSVVILNMNTAEWLRPARVKLLNYYTS